jgi:hypothetical protein
MRIFLETQAKLHIQQLIIQKKLKLVCSFILRYENNENPNISNRDSIAQFFINASEYVGNENMEDIRKMADEFMKQGIKMKDATHLACAIKVMTPLTFLDNLEEKTDA